MSGQTDNIANILREFELNNDEIALYVFLAKTGESSALRISKQIHTGRTKVYRILDKLIKSGLVEQILGHRGFVFKVTSFERLNELLLKEKRKLSYLEDSLPVVVKELESLQQGNDDNNRVVYFSGVEGFKQVTWNSLKAEKDLFIFEMVTDMSAYVDEKFSEQIREELVKRRIHVSQITNLTHIPAHTDVIKLVENYWEVRYINPRVLKTSYEMLIYNDVVAMYNMRGKNIFCVEIHDKNLAMMQKQLFKFIWQKGKEMKKIGNHGEVKLPVNTD